jgi:aldose 1-epimerase
LIGDGDRTIAVDATPNASWAHVYMPRKRGFFCFEPVTHRPDALNAPEGEEGGIAILQPGEALAMSMTLNVR